MLFQKACVLNARFDASFFRVTNYSTSAAFGNSLNPSAVLSAFWASIAL